VSIDRDEDNLDIVKEVVERLSKQTDDVRGSTSAKGKAKARMTTKSNKKCKLADFALEDKYRPSSLAATKLEMQQEFR
jgi:hypothetical protein